MSDRVAVFESGGVAQIGTPDALYKEPATAFVANFIGENNTLAGKIERLSGTSCVVEISSGSPIMATAIGEMAVGQAAQMTIRPELIRLAEPGSSDGTHIEATVEGRIYLGDHQRLLMRLGDGQSLTAKIAPDASFATGKKLVLSWATADCRAFPAETRK
jgi:putative spermidine/putrescine transport system ATP-binding protein